MANSDAAACCEFLKTLTRNHRLYCIKTHRIELPPDLPVIPCLDHEAQLTGHADPHISVYLEDSGGDVHEVGLIPVSRSIVVDVASTMAETSREATQQLVGQLRKLFPGSSVSAKSPSILRGDRRVSVLLRAQLRLRDVLHGNDGPDLRFNLEKVRAISDLMEKELRVYSWSVRTMSPVLGGAGVAAYIAIGIFKHNMSDKEIETIRAVSAFIFSTVFLYFGMRAVYLTELATRVWKRATEYKLILDARKNAAKVATSRVLAG